MELTPWKRCLQQLEGELTAQQFNTWIRPLHVIENKNAVHLLAPNRFVQNWISERYLSRIEELLSNKTPEKERVLVKLDVGSFWRPASIRRTARRCLGVSDQYALIYLI